MKEAEDNAIIHRAYKRVIEISNITETGEKYDTINTLLVPIYEELSELVDWDQVEEEKINKPTQYTITKQEYEALKAIEGQLTGLSDITKEVEKYAAVYLLLEPIIDKFNSVRPKEVGGAQ